ncbi:MAG: hypothetical protein H6825_14660 [Planctomycetes bacterium]|nr:hypothetical protein [Planctomycetota bacterium]
MRVSSLSVALLGCLAGVLALTALPGPARGVERATPGFALGAPRSDVRECKPQGPLEIDLDLVAPPDADGRLELDLALSSFVALDDLRVRVLLPDGAELLDDPDGLLAPDGGWTAPPEPSPLADEAAAAALRGVTARGDGAAPARADDGRRPLRPGERGRGRLALRLPSDAAWLQLVLEAEGTFRDANGGTERVVVQRSLVWGEPDETPDVEVAVDHATGARRKQVVLPVSHRQEH